MSFTQINVFAGMNMPELALTPPKLTDPYALLEPAAPAIVLVARVVLNTDVETMVVLVVDDEVLAMDGVVLATDTEFDASTPYPELRRATPATAETAMTAQIAAASVAIPLLVFNYESYGRRRLT